MSRIPILYPLKLQHLLNEYLEYKEYLVSIASLLVIWERLSFLICKMTIYSSLLVLQICYFLILSDVLSVNTRVFRNLDSFIGYKVASFCQFISAYILLHTLPNTVVLQFMNLIISMILVAN